MNIRKKETVCHTNTVVFVSPVTMRAKASNQLNIKMSKGVYRFKVKGIYGENYQTLKSFSTAQTVKVKRKKWFHNY